MKKLINRKTGNFLTQEEAIRLCCKLHNMNGVTYIEHKSVYGYATPELAEKANLRAVCETYEGYVFAFTGTVYDAFSGYKVFVVAIQKLPPRFEELYPDYVVIG